MFSKATANFVQQIDPEGSLIHVSRLNNSHKLVLMGLVVKRKRIWFWQRPKYQPTDFTLSDLLQGNRKLSPGSDSEDDFLSYEGTFGDKLTGRVDTEAGPVNLSLEGQGFSKLESCFGKLKKENLKVKELIVESRDRQVDMQHVLVQQLEKRAEVLTVVKQRILTTDPCSITQTKKEQCIFQGIFGLVGMLGSSLRTCLTDTNKMEADSDVVLKIRPGTVIAYSVLELEIKKDGRFGICLRPGTIGGIEEDSPAAGASCDYLDTVDGKCNGHKASETSQNGSHEMDLSPLAKLPEATRFSLFKRLQQTLKDRGALSYLQCVLEDLCGGESLTMADNDELSESQKQTLSAILDSHTKDSQGGAPPHLNATHLLVSAMEELPEETQRLLSKSCPDFLEALNTLMCGLKDNSEPLSSQCLPVLLQDSQAFQQAEQLLNSTNVSLRKDGDRVWIETRNQAVLSVVLCLSIQGLTFLSEGLEQ